MMGGIIAFALAQLGKRLPTVPMREGQPAKTRTIVGVLSLIFVVGQAYIGGTLESETTTKLVEEAIYTFFTASGAYTLWHK